MSLVEVPNFTEKLPKSINPTTLLQLAPSVAAKMEWQKEVLHIIIMSGIMIIKLNNNGGELLLLLILIARFIRD